MEPFLFFSLLLTAASSNEPAYLKYPRLDAYVSSCAQKEINYGSSHELQVRRLLPDPRSQNWGEAIGGEPRDYIGMRTFVRPREANETSSHAVTSRDHTRSWHKTDKLDTCNLRNDFACGSVQETASATANVPDTFTMTRGTETATYKYPQSAGPYYPDSLKEGSLWPFDQSPLSGWCGEESIGDRVAFLVFDLRDFSAEAMSTVTLRMTAKAFPLDARVQVRGACNATARSSRRDSENVRVPLHESSVTWNTAPFIDDTDFNRTICEWAIEEEKQDDMDAVLFRPFTCDVTSLAKAHAASSDNIETNRELGGPIDSGQLCLTIDMVPEIDNPRDPVVFWSRESQESILDDSGSGGIFNDLPGTPRFPQQVSPQPDYHREQGPRRSDARAQKVDRYRGNEASGDPHGGGGGIRGLGGRREGPHRDERVAGLEYGTVQVSGIEQKATGAFTTVPRISIAVPTKTPAGAGATFRALQATTAILVITALCAPSARQSISTTPTQTSVKFARGQRNGRTSRRAVLRSSCIFSSFSH